MIRNIYCIRDDKAGFLDPFVDLNDATALRNFTFAMEKDTVMGVNNKDFSLYCVGTFNTGTGIIEAPDRPILLVDGSSVRGVE